MNREDFAGNSSINDSIHDCFQHLEEADVSKIRRKLRFHARADNKREFFHTFRELILGSYLARNGFRVRAYQKYGVHDPDWSVLGGQGELAALIEITNFHADEKTEAEIDAALAAGEWACPDVDEADASLRFHKAIWNKCSKYKGLAKSLNVPYMVGCYCFFSNPVERSTVMESLHAADSGLFRGGDGEGYPEVSGLVVYDEKTLWVPPDTVANAYVFEYFPNPHAVRPFAFPLGYYFPPMSINKQRHYQLMVRFLSGDIEKDEYLRLTDALLASEPCPRIPGNPRRNHPSISLS
jgi:hypothetical protein